MCLWWNISVTVFLCCRGPSNAFYCFAHDYSAHFFCVASFLWTTTIAFTLHRTVVKHKTDVEEFGSIFHLYVWGMQAVDHLPAFLWSYMFRIKQIVGQLSRNFSRDHVSEDTNYFVSVTSIWINVLDKTQNGPHCIAMFDALCLSVN